MSKKNTTPAEPTTEVAEVAEVAQAPEPQAPVVVAPPQPSQGGSGARLCLCGCGAPTKATFAPGHDARFYGWLAEYEVTGASPRASQDPVTQAALRSWVLPATKASLRTRFLAAQAKEATTPAQAQAQKADDTSWVGPFFPCLPPLK